MSDVYYPSAPSIFAGQKLPPFPKKLSLSSMEMLYILTLPLGLKLGTTSFVQAVHSRAVGTGRREGVGAHSHILADSLTLFPVLMRGEGQIMP